MKFTIKSIDNYESEATITFDAAELEKTKSRACKQLASRVNIPGFRKGKVPPAQILENYFGKGAILDEAAEILIRKGANDLLNTMKYMPVTEMKPDIVTCEEGKDFVFTLTYTPYPQVTVGEYKGLEVEKVVKPVTDEDVEHQIEHIRENHAEMIDAPADDKVADGDFITLDYVGTVNGEKFKGGEAKGAPLEIGSHSFIDNFEDQLIGLKIGEEKDVKVTFPEGYHAKDLAEKPAVFHCKVLSIKRKKLPELDEEFIKKVSGFDTLEKFQESIRKNLEAMAERNALYKQREEVIQKATDNMKVDMPPVMIDNRVEQMINELDANLQMQGLKLEVYLAANGMSADDLRKEYREDAEKNLRMEMLLEEVAQIENIKVEDMDLNMEIARMSSMYRATPKQIIKALKDNGQIQTVISNVRRQKAMQFIFENMAGAEKADDVAADDKATAKDEVAETKDDVKAPVEKVAKTKPDATAEKVADDKEKSDSAVDKNADS